MLVLGFPHTVLQGAEKQFLFLLCQHFSAVDYKLRRFICRQVVVAYTQGATPIPLEVLFLRVLAVEVQVNAVAVNVDAVGGSETAVCTGLYTPLWL